MGIKGFMRKILAVVSLLMAWMPACPAHAHDGHHQHRTPAESAASDDGFCSSCTCHSGSSHACSDALVFTRTPVSGPPMFCRTRPQFPFFAVPAVRLVVIPRVLREGAALTALQTVQLLI